MVTVEADVQLVYWPVKLIAKADWPGLPIFGLICVMTGVPGVTVKPPDNVSGVPFVVTVISDVPTVALGGILRVACTCVRLLTVTMLGVGNPPPKVTEVKPCWKLVNWPSMVTVTVWPA